MIIHSFLFLPCNKSLNYALPYGGPDFIIIAAIDFCFGSFYKGNCLDEFSILLLYSFYFLYFVHHQSPLTLPS